MLQTLDIKGYYEALAQQPLAVVDSVKTREFGIEYCLESASIVNRTTYQDVLENTQEVIPVALRADVLACRDTEKQGLLRFATGIINVQTQQYAGDTSYIQKDPLYFSFGAREHANNLAQLILQAGKSESINVVGLLVKGAKVEEDRQIPPDAPLLDVKILQLGRYHARSDKLQEVSLPTRGRDCL